MAFLCLLYTLIYILISGSSSSFIFPQILNLEHYYINTYLLMSLLCRLNISLLFKPKMHTSYLFSLDAIMLICRGFGFWAFFCWKCNCFRNPETTIGCWHTTYIWNMWLKESPHIYNNSVSLSTLIGSWFLGSCYRNVPETW